MARTPTPPSRPAPAEPVRSWSAARLPKLRDQTVAHLGDPRSFIHKLMAGTTGALGTRPVSGPYGVADAGSDPASLSVLSHDLAQADLYWVTKPMAALACSAAESLDEVRWCAGDQPAGSGLLVWDHGISLVDWGESKVPVSAVSWHPHCDYGLAVCLYVARHVLADMMAQHNAPALGIKAEVYASRLAEAMADLPPLLPVWSTEVATTTEWSPVILSAPFAALMTTLYATWTLMMQPGIADQTPQEVEPKVRKAIARSGRRVPDVTLVELRRRYAPRDHGDAGPPGRNYQHRWIVGGHWRNQAHGPGRADRRKIWIAPFTKGPDGAPMLATTKVNVWRR